MSRLAELLDVETCSGVLAALPPGCALFVVAHRGLYGARITHKGDTIANGAGSTMGGALRAVVRDLERTMREVAYG